MRAMAKTEDEQIRGMISIIEYGVDSGAIPIVLGSLKSLEQFTLPAEYEPIVTLAHLTCWAHGDEHGPLTKFLELIEHVRPHVSGRAKLFESVVSLGLARIAMEAATGLDEEEVSMTIEEIKSGKLHDRIVILLQTMKGKTVGRKKRGRAKTTEQVVASLNDEYPLEKLKDTVGLLYDAVLSRNNAVGFMEGILGLVEAHGDKILQVGEDSADKSPVRSKSPVKASPARKASPVRKKTASPGRQPTPSPPRTRTRAAREKSSSPVKVPSPVKEVAHGRGSRRARVVKKRSPSASPVRQPSSSPARRPSPSPARKVAQAESSEDSPEVKKKHKKKSKSKSSKKKRRHSKMSRHREPSTSKSPVRRKRKERKTLKEPRDLSPPKSERRRKKSRTIDYDSDDALVGNLIVKKPVTQRFPSSSRSSSPMIKSRSHSRARVMLESDSSDGPDVSPIKAAVERVSSERRRRKKEKALRRSSSKHKKHSKSPSVKRSSSPKRSASRKRSVSPMKRSASPKERSRSKSATRKSLLNPEKPGKPVTWEDSEEDSPVFNTNVKQRYEDDQKLVDQSRKYPKKIVSKGARGPIKKGGDRRRWTREEEERLLEGLRKHGPGNWKSILRDFDFGDRTNVNLKDKWRNMQKAGRRYTSDSESGSGSETETDDQSE